MTDRFQHRMAELDALIERCRGHGAFASGIIRDTSNRSNREWPWWSIQVERTNDTGFEKYRRTAEISLNCPAPGVPSVFKANWLLRVWRGVSPDTFTASGGWVLAWNIPSVEELDSTVEALLREAEIAIGYSKDIGSNT